MYDKYTWNLCENEMVNILDCVWEISTKILDQFPISSSFNGIGLSIFANFHMKCLMKFLNDIIYFMTDKKNYLEFEWKFNDYMRHGFNYDS